jgi:RimJ/RimL family protein N-acetyltransferase
MTDRDDVIVRAVRAGDAEGYRACIDRVARARVYLAITEAFPAGETKAFVDDMIARDLPFYVAVAGDGRIIGWCDISQAKPRPERPGFAHFGAVGMGLDEGYRGRGHGTALLRAALAHADRIGLERVELQVFAGNDAALALYKKLGFVMEGAKRRARKLDGRYDDLLLMARLIGTAGE